MLSDQLLLLDQSGKLLNDAMSEMSGTWAPIVVAENGEYDYADSEAHATHMLITQGGGSTAQAPTELTLIYLMPDAVEIRRKEGAAAALAYVRARPEPLLETTIKIE